MSAPPVRPTKPPGAAAQRGAESAGGEGARPAATSELEAGDSGRRWSARSPEFARTVGRSVGVQSAALLLALGILVAVVGVQNANFFLPANFANIGVIGSLLALVALAETIVMIAGGLDISVGPIAGVSSVVAALALQGATGTGIGVLAGLGAGLAAGLINGVLITAFQVNAVIATLATYSAYGGLAYIFTSGSAVAIGNATFLSLATAKFLGVPLPVWIDLGTAAILIAFMHYTDFGRNIYAIGANAVAARLAGIRVNRYLVAIYALSGLLSGLAGVMLAAQTALGQGSSGAEQLSLAAITAVLLGGTALTGGRGTILGTVLAVIVLSTLNDGLILLGVSSYYQLVVEGVVLVGAVTLQQRPWRNWRRQTGETP